MLRRFLPNVAGNMSILMMGVMAGIALIVGGVVDYAALANQKRSLQSVADGAALAAARELIIASTKAKASNDRVQAVAEAYVAANFHGGQTKINARIVDKGTAVQVSLTADPQTYFPGPIGLNARPIPAKATAEISGGGNVCMVGLDESAPSTLEMSDKARVTAVKCAIYSNSRNAASLKLANNSKVKADLVCVAGGVSGAKSAVSPNEPIEDCPPLSDPLRDRPEPKVGLLTCDNILGSGSILGKDLLGSDGKLLSPNGLVGGLLSGEALKKKNLLGEIAGGDLVGNLAPGLLVTGGTLEKPLEYEPGVYCGGLNIIGGHVKLKAGTYVLNNGGIVVANGGSLVGENVGFYLTGALGLSTIQFSASSTISLTAPKTGDMSGMLFFEDRSVVFKFPHIMASNNARNLVGTIYLPGNTLEIDAKEPIADQSDYTVIVAKKFEMTDGPELVLNTDYDTSPIPLPEGVGNKAKQTVRLSK